MAGEVFSPLWVKDAFESLTRYGRSTEVYSKERPDICICEIKDLKAVINV